MALVWNTRYATGLSWQDAQHQELFKRINDLLDAMKSGKGVDAIGEVFSFLEKYVITHFGNEEQFMKQHNYTDIVNHKAAHVQFVSTLAELKSAYLKNTGATSVSLKLQSLLTNWLIQYIGTIDIKLATFASTVK
jgi:hemerythrin-like metal-binding protein